LFYIGVKMLFPLDFMSTMILGFEKNKVERAEGEHNYDVLKIGPSG